MRNGVLALGAALVFLCATASGDPCGVVPTGAPVTINANPPQPMPTNWTGGAIEAGTYHMVSYSFYNAGCPYVPSGNDAVGMTLTSTGTGGTIATAYDFTSGATHSALTQSGTYTTSPGGNMTYAYTCPKASSFSGHYTATPTSNGKPATIATWSMPPLCGTYYQVFSK
jgi:hypothetical protein